MMLCAFRNWLIGLETATVSLFFQVVVSLLIRNCIAIGTTNTGTDRSRLSCLKAAEMEIVVGTRSRYATAPPLKRPRAPGWKTLEKKMIYQPHAITTAVNH